MGHKITIGKITIGDEVVINLINLKFRILMENNNLNKSYRNVNLRR